MNKTAKICAISGLIALAAAGAGYGIIFGTKPEVTANTLPAVSSEEAFPAASSNEIIAQAGSEQTEIILSDSGITVNGKGASVSGNTVTISQTGNYSISGTLSEGQIYVEAGGDDIVILSLNGAEISNSDQAAVYVENAGNTLLLLEDGTTNRFQSGTAVEIGAVEEDSDSTASGGAVYAKDDLGITGTGSLQVFGYINNGIHSSNNITIESGNIEVTAVNNGIKGKDSVTISGGKISVRSGGDGIKSDDDTGDGYGVINISGGNISIESEGDGIQSETALEISGGEFSITSGGGSENSSSMSGNVVFGDFGGFGGFRGNAENLPVMTEALPKTIDGGAVGEFSRDKDALPVMPENSDRGRFGENNEIPPAMPENGSGFGGNGEEPPAMPENGDREGFKGGNGFGGRGGFGNRNEFDGESGDFGGFGGNRGEFGGFGGFRGENSDMDDLSATSTKGIKCGGNILISGGKFSIDSYDDAIHSNASIIITGGEFTLATGDDGIHADKELTVEDGNILVTDSYEGLEANLIRLSGGNVDVTASDDGINAYGGTNNFGGFGGSSKTTEETPMLYFSGANVVINAGGDGIDSNGSIFVEAGTVIVNGPTNSGNGAIDSGSENGGKCIITGGTILAIGSAGMDEGFSSESSQCSFRIRPETAILAGSEITISDSEGNVLFRHTAVKNASSVVFSCPELQIGEKYILSVDGQETEIEQNSVSESSGSGGNSGFGFGGRNRW